MKAFFSLRSLRARIFIIVLVIGVVPGMLMKYGILNNYEQRAVEHRIATVQNQLKIVGNHLLSNHYFSDTKTNESVINAELEMISNLYEGRVMIVNSGLKVVKDTYALSEGKTMISEEVIRCLQGESMSHYDREHGYIEMTTPITDTAANTEGTSTIVGIMVTSISNDSIVATMEVLNRKAAILEYLIVVGILAFAIVLSNVLTKPFSRVTDAISQV